MVAAEAMICLVRHSNVIQIDLGRVAQSKLAVNQDRFPLHS